MNGLGGGLIEQVVGRLLHHMLIVGVAVAIGTCVAMPVGVWLSRHTRAAEPVIAITGFLQTIPSLALLALVLPILGIGLLPAVAALSLYALLPILRNTYASLRAVPAHLPDVAKAMGMSSTQVLLRVEIPLSVPVIIAGVRLSTVYMVSWAVLAALIGAGGLGVLIFEGLSTYDFTLILAGAIPAAFLAVVAGLVFTALEHGLSPGRRRGAVPMRKTV